MNTIPIIHLDQWVRREAKTSLANFHNSQNPESRSATMDTISSELAWRWARKLQGLRGGSRWVLWVMLAPVHLVRAPAVCPLCKSPEARRQGNNPACASLLNFSPISITHSRSMKSSSATASHACRGMTSWSLSDFFTRLWSRSILPA